MANINKIRLSGTTYNIEDENASKTVELTQTQYDALATKEPNTYYVITDATAVDIANYYNKTEVDTALATKQATLVSGTNISIDTANTINCTLPITANTDTLAIGGKNFVVNTTKGSITLGRGSNANAYRSLAGGEGSKVAIGAVNGLAWGIGANVNMNDNAEGAASIGYYTKSTIRNAISIGRYNSIADANTGENFGSSGNTLFAVGNGTSEQTRHNAFEIRQNGDIYVNDGTNDVKLQDTITATTANTTALGGLKLVSLTQAQYDALSTKDASTIYFING